MGLLAIAPDPRVGSRALLAMHCRQAIVKQWLLGVKHPPVTSRRLIFNLLSVQRGACSRRLLTQSSAASVGSGAAFAKAKAGCGKRGVLNDR